MKRIVNILILSILLLAPIQGSAVDYYSGPDLTAYRQYKDVNRLNIQVPTVVEVDFSNDELGYEGFSVVEANSYSIGYYYNRTYIAPEEVLYATSSQALGQTNLMTDNSEQTFTEFELPDNYIGSAEITIQIPKLVRANSISLHLDNYVALPATIQISAVTGDKEKIVLATTKMTGQTVNFPATRANVWRVHLTYTQPLRITEIKIPETSPQTDQKKFIRFLAQPNTDYRIYFNSDRPTNYKYQETGDLYSNEGVIKAQAGRSQSNPQYVIADTDYDGVPDISDNCIDKANTDQTDINANGRGDDCEDFDKDGIGNTTDNCPNIPNSNQDDTDGDKIGDACDSEESRITEKYPWLPWLGIGFAALVIVIMFAVTLRTTPIKKS